MRFIYGLILLCMASGAPLRAAFAAGSSGDGSGGAVQFDDPKATVYDLPPAVAIQRRQYQMGSSFGLSLGYVPVDSFNRGFSFTANYRYALSNYLTWEVLSFGYVLNRETNLKRDLFNFGYEVKNLGLGGVLDYPRQIYMTGVHYSPMYSKSLLFNSRLTYSETSLFLGAGALHFNQVGPKPMVAPGLSTRIYISSSTAVTAYFRDYFYLDDNAGLTGILDFGIGLEFKLSDLVRSGKEP